MEKRKTNLKNILNVISGNFLEMYDFTVYGYYSESIGKNFFPTNNEFVSLLLAFLVFGMSYAIRPIGAVILGSYIDTHGRKKGLLITLILMSIGTLLICCTPSYFQIGIFAPIIVILGRLLQGFSAGAELGGVSVYLYEIAPVNKKAFYVCWQSASQQLAVIFAAIIGIILSYLFTSKQMNNFGWRIPFFIGLMIIPYLFWLRNKLEETEIFKKNKNNVSIKTILLSIIKNFKIIILSVIMTITTSCSFYMITVFFRSYTKIELGFNSQQSFLILILIGISNLFWLPIISKLSDKIGRRPLLLLFSFLIFSTFYPALSILIKSHNIIIFLWFSFMYAGFNSTLLVTLIEIIPNQVKATGFSIAYSISVTLGGFTPSISIFLINYTNNKASPGIFITIVSLITLLATIFILPKYSKYYWNPKIKY